MEMSSEDFTLTARVPNGNQASAEVVLRHQHMLQKTPTRVTGRCKTRSCAHYISPWTETVHIVVYKHCSKVLPPTYKHRELETTILVMQLK